VENGSSKIIQDALIVEEKSISIQEDPIIQILLCNIIPGVEILVLVFACLRSKHTQTQT